MKPCGTYAAYQRHRLAGETACRPCLAANREWKREYRERVRREAPNRTRDAILDLLTTHDRWMSIAAIADFIIARHPEWTRGRVERMVWRMKSDDQIECRWDSSARRAEFRTF